MNFRGKLFSVTLFIMDFRLIIPGTYQGPKYSIISDKRRVANNRRVWKKYLNLINEGSGTNGGPEIFVTLYKEANFFDFYPIFQ